MRQLSILKGMVAIPGAVGFALSVMASAWSQVPSQLETVPFGKGDNAFTMEFVTIGNPGNKPDTSGAPNPAGSVGYTYRIGKFEVSRDMIDKYNAEYGKANGREISLDDLSAYGGNGAGKPATGVSWNEAARFVNWLNTSTGHHEAYKFSTKGVNDKIELWNSSDSGYDASNPYRNRLAKYVLPSYDEWYKAAYYDPKSNSYYDYPTGSDTVPTSIASGTDAGTAVYHEQAGPAGITEAGGLSPYGVMGLGGNVYEWEESSSDLANDNGSSARGVRGSSWLANYTGLLSSTRFDHCLPSREDINIGFRVASLDPAAPSAMVEIEKLNTRKRRDWIAALGQDPAGSIAKLRQEASKCGTPELQRRKACLALAALALGDTDLPIDACEFEGRPDPGVRTWFIEEFRRWELDRKALVASVKDSSSPALRSAVCLGLGQIPVEQISSDDKNLITELATKWYSHPDSSTHSAVAWLMRQWKLPEPTLPDAKQIVDGRNWFVNSQGATLARIDPDLRVLRGDPRFLSLLKQAAVDSKVSEQLFWLANREVTRREFEEFLNDTGYEGEKPTDRAQTYDNQGASPTLEHPVQDVNWYDAVMYCNWLSRREGRSPAYRNVGKEMVKDHKSRLFEVDKWEPVAGANGYRLPRAWEWEYASRAGSKTTWSIGSDESLLASYCQMNSSKLASPSGMKLPNAWGLHDMHGNVWEWCSDVVDEGSHREGRGGSWSNPANWCQSASRTWSTPLDRGNYGIRVALGSSAVPSASQSVSQIKDEPKTKKGMAIGELKEKPSDTKSLIPAKDSTNTSGSKTPPAIFNFADSDKSPSETQAAVQAWADYLGQKVEMTNTLGMQFRLIPPGEFMMGSTENAQDLQAMGLSTYASFSEANEKPQHRVQITKPMYVGAHEVTLRQFQEYYNADKEKHKTESEKEGKGGYGYDGKTFGQSPSYSPWNTGWNQPLADYLDHPVVNVSWNDAVSFCLWLTAKERASGHIRADQEYRLLDEAQWEYAARGGSRGLFGFGSEPDELTEYGNVKDAEYSGKFQDDLNHPFKYGAAHLDSDGYVFTAPVGSYKPNHFGLYDMHGNVWEWCRDYFDAWAYQSRNGIVTDPFVAPRSPTALYDSSARNYHVDRGGSYRRSGINCRSAGRGWLLPWGRDSDIGFRISLQSVDKTPPPIFSFTDSDKSPSETQAAVQAWADYSGQKVELTNTLGMQFRLIPPGEFMMGGNESERDLEALGVPIFANFSNREERPKHRVQITRPMYVGTYEVTLRQFQEYYNADKEKHKTDAEKDGVGGYGYDGKTFGHNPSYSPWNTGWNQPVADYLDHPVVNVSWNDAVSFCKWLTAKERASGNIRADQEYRLLDEAQWEYAARGGNVGLFGFGSNTDELIEYGNVKDSNYWAKFGTTPNHPFTDGEPLPGSDGYIYTSPVGRFAPNGFGLHDMHGNVHEWCQDPFDGNAYLRRRDLVKDPVGFGGLNLNGRGRPQRAEFLRSHRGGGWSSAAVFCRSANRNKLRPTERYFDVGFRISLQSVR